MGRARKAAAVPRPPIVPSEGRIPMTVRLALVVGDPAGISAELMARLLAEKQAVERAALLVIGDRRLLAEGARAGGVELDLQVVRERAEARPEPGRPLLYDTGNADPAAIAPGQASAAGGRAVLENFTLALDLAREGVVDAITF